MTNYNNNINNKLKRINKLLDNTSSYTRSNYIKTTTEIIKNNIDQKSIDKILDIKINNNNINKKQLSINKLIVSEIGMIYFLSDMDNRYIRIGKTKNLLNLYERFRKHQSGSPLRLKLDGILVSDDYSKLDKQIRKEYKAKGYHSHSDWYYYSSEIRAFIDNNCLEINYRNSYFD